MANRNNKRGKLLHVLFKGEVMNTIKKLQQKSGAESKADVIRDGLKLYEILDSLTKDGSVTVLNKKGEKFLLSLPRKKPSIS